MTKINVVIDQDKEAKIPQFKDLTVGQYFRINFTDENDDIYIKLPIVFSYDRTQCGTCQCIYNAYNITSNRLCNIYMEKECELIDNVEIHI